MYRIRFHGRGGHGMKTASRMLGSALFAEGFEVQDAPRYGAERRGAPIFAYVRASREPIHERGIIRAPDLAVVADDTLVAIRTAGVLSGLDGHSVLLLFSDEPAERWSERLKLKGPVLTLPAGAASHGELPFAGARCAGAAARLLGVVSRACLEGAIATELGGVGAEALAASRERALEAFDALEAHAGTVGEGGASDVRGAGPPDWIDLPFEPARISAPTIHAGATSVQVRTGLWRTMRPVIDHSLCHRCSWVCSTFCPDGAILVDADGAPEIDLDHCKGCLVCVAVCPPHAIGAVPESEAAAAEEATP